MADKVQVFTSIPKVSELDLDRIGLYCPTKKGVTEQVVI